ncbi:MAG TPA: ATP-binding protein [Gemmatimonadales bacterium]|nr:ATP-binding protein [Gemmatimonadales bacterium]
MQSAPLVPPGTSASASRVGPYLGSIAIVLAMTALCFVLRAHLQVTDVAMLYLLAVVIVAGRYARGPSILASALSIVLFDLGFVPPYGRFDVHDAAFLLTFAMMFLVAIVMSGLTTRIRAAAETAGARERRTAVLYDLSRELASATRAEEVADVVTRHLGAAVGGEAAFAWAGGKEAESPLHFPEVALFADQRVREGAQWVYAWDLSAGAGTGEFSDLPTLLLPVRAALHRHGVVAIRGSGVATLAEADRRTLELLARHAALTLERLSLSEQREQAEVAVEAERLRATLLSSISHDLRTPLASIEGAGSTLLEQTTPLPPAVSRELLTTIVEESQRMTRMVTNLLDMVRVESGLLTARKSWVPLEEVIGVARLRLDAQLREYPVEVHLPADPLLVPIDELLMEQVVVNLLENAARYTPAGTSITVSARRAGDAVEVEVADRGPGIPPGEEEAVFRKFHRLGGADRSDPAARAGTGLGLAICRGVVTAHGGKIWVERRPGGGASFRFTLPAGDPPPAIAAEPAG